jgi:hypothetical protein
VLIHQARRRPTNLHIVGIEWPQFTHLAVIASDNPGKGVALEQHGGLHVFPELQSSLLGVCHVMQYAVQRVVCGAFPVAIFTAAEQDQRQGCGGLSDGLHTGIDSRD